MKKQMICSIVIVTLGFVSLGFFVRSSHKINETKEEHSYVSIDFSRKLRSEELKIEALKKAGLIKIRAGQSHTELPKI